MNRLVGAKSYLQSALEINEEMQAVLLPLLKTVENEASDDTHAMLRAVRTLSMNQYRDINELDCILDSVIETKKTTPDLKIELEPACNAIKKLMALLNTMIDSGGEDRDLDLLSIATDLTQQAGKEIARVRGVEYQ
ncbi:hypothetical protein [Xenorhabdus griffiniae]|uniref:Uncharacterized protein n=1 Tax=Xenorhabdus griffiniae TaxID=351672 RepID=A0ABY9XFI0_9GAMM|nr:hypothetical protein [Xenorhabdus griffiniae]MBD1227702.1 hypothetical protein [Xenorhabdus griffiniae]MBE8587023.1 hypothetical protein [Xenorhabdus griffiniae]WMV71687.1 hypothetical protein QL128_16330 [Xenorhabdus griffiniae]WNH01364.1 hypothetical protein QL112_016335 [Xenorhabdus griffiniae]